MRLLLPAIVGLSLFACASDDDSDDAPSDGGRRDASDTGPREDAGFPDIGPIDASPGGSFTERSIDSTGIHGQGIEVVDFEGDGDLDVLVGMSLTDTVRLYLNEGGGAFTIAQPTQDDSIVGMHAVAADIDGDGDRDIAAIGLFDRAVGLPSLGEVTWFENGGDPLGTWTRHEITGLTFGAPIYLQTDDLTGDGTPDLVVGCTFNDPDGNGVYWFRNTGGGFDGPIAIQADLLNVRTVLIHDVDGDGALDVLAASTGGGELVWYENERTGADENPTFARHTIASVAAPFGMRVANFDVDPELELVSSSDNGAGGQIVWYDPPADPKQPWTGHTVSDSSGDQATRLAAADFDGDGLTDVASVTYEDNEVRVFFADGAGGFSTEQIMGGYTGSNAINSGDLDRDGRTDLVTTTYGNGDTDRISWWDNEP